MNHNKISFYYDLGAFILLALPVSMYILKLFGYELMPFGMLSLDKKILALAGGIVLGILYFMIKYTRFHNITKTIAKSQDFPEVFTIIEKLCREMEIGVPEVGFLESSIPNAFVYKHRNKPVVVLTIPLIEILDDKELETVLAHELAHIKNKDMELRKYSLLLRFALFLNPLIHLIEPFVSRSREYLADETAAWMTNAPKKLASALLKIEEYTSSYKDLRFSTSVPPEVFFFEWGFCAPYILSRSPSTEKRVKRLIFLSSRMTICSSP
ncbi:MAG: M48 family metalloprotease [Euryarchaeota archaeon]|nr:M48 family metalloprotease [Euryarchaeota archaeon]